MKKLFIVLAIATTAFASCNDDKATNSTTETATTEVVAPAPATTETVAPVATDASTTTATTAH